jgi:hypothetical protein
MNSIKKDKKSEAIKHFFYQNLLKESKKLHEKHISFFPTTFDRNADTYYSIREKRTLEPESFEEPDCISFEDFERKLTILWESLGQHEFIPMARPLANLAKLLYNIEDQNEEISEFIYVMF